jgi:hypothetical protein
VLGQRDSRSWPDDVPDMTAVPAWARTRSSRR